ncbi:DNA polymerase III beta chain [Vibrio phage 1.115.B._10N.222.49.B11]|nr:DNA polymerase III beta chain [Vibrio phage 1.115.A._10N.222.49.B11]AUR88592.1 DNA polymerase III beta chain [Vibrio phage 1.115.B._10N.222.49.B11]
MIFEPGYGDQYNKHPSLLITKGNGMNNFKLDARQVKAAMVMMAKNDVRYYLNGLLIGGKKIVATDGHRMIVVDCESADFEPKIFAIKGTLLKSAIECEFVFIGEDHGIVTTKNSTGTDQDKVVKFAIVEGRYPEWSGVIPNEKPKKVSKAGFNVGYVADIAKAAELLGSEFQIGEFTFYDRGRVAIDINTPENNAQCVIMQVRL